jgi:protease-4
MTEKKIGFGKIFWPSLIAALIVSVIGTIIFLLVVGGIIGNVTNMEAEPLVVKDNTVLHITLDGEIAEISDTKFNKSQLNFDSKIGLSDLLFGFKSAAEDERVKGLFIDIKDLNCGYATAKEIRDAINEFEKSGKFAVAYNSGELITQKEYYVASAANENYGFPTSTMEFIGLGTELMFFKNTLDKLEVEMQVIRGKNNDFKSAVEPFFRENMSDSSRTQIERYLTSMWSDIRKDLSVDRKIGETELDNIAQKVLIHRVEDAVTHKLMDGVKYRDEVIDILSKKAGIKGDEELQLQAFEKYSKKKFYQQQTLTKVDNPNIAVILAEGDVSVEGDGLTSKKICKLFQDVRKNKSIKTVVFRINSPGGSALASDEIWREVKLTNKVKKVVVSMGNVAASGGYYIAAPASAIFAEPNTITGSIGVFGVIPYTGKMLTNKLGLTFDRASTNNHSVMSTNRKLTEEELSIIQMEVDKIYSEFLQRVAEGRGMTVEQVNAIARGRVWTGRDALRIGLVDKLGGFTDAINYAAKKANISDQKVLYYPLMEEDPIAEIIEKLEEKTASSASMSSVELPVALIEYYKQLKALESYKGMQMRLPYEINIR